MSSKKYNALGSSLLLPRYLLPGFYFTGDTSIFSATTGSADPLRWHRWAAGATYRLDAAHLGYFGQYSYQRYRPIFGMSMNDYAADFGSLTFARGDGTSYNVHYFEERRGVTGSVTVPVKRHAFSTAYFYEDRFPQTNFTSGEIAGLALAGVDVDPGIFAGARVAYAYADPELYPASISLENGRRVRMLTSISDKVLGSNEENEQIIFSGDWREYVRLGGHHVLGLRASGGMTWGDQLLQGTFGMGGALGEGLLAGPPSLFYFPLRGLPVSALSRTRAMLLSSEYRIPLLSPQRGLGTTPFYVKNIHGSLFADYGDAWNANNVKKGAFTDFFDDFFLGVGAELRGDFIVGHGLPLMGRLGYGIIVLNRDRLGTFQDDLTKRPAKYGVAILQFGTSF
ncbi:MAG: hypothetical protein HY465_01480 [Deltaproteobacteria bacterium]|nr:hypothetical protein [Deltaproteobacteria bacterium]